MLTLNQTYPDKKVAIYDLFETDLMETFHLVKIDFVLLLYYNHHNSNNKNIYL